MWERSGRGCALKCLTCLMLKFYLLSVFLSSHAFAETCTFVNSCSCKFENGSIIDLSSLASSDGPRFKNVKPLKIEPYLYSYNPCTNFQLGDKGDCSHGVAVCQKAKESNDYQNCGDQSSASFSWNATKSSIVLTYSTRKRKAHVTLRCSENQETPQLIVFGETDVQSREYEMELISRCACSDLCQSYGLSTGSALVIIFFVLLLFYMILGIVYNHLVRGAHGWELIPNYDFWKDFPLLVRDGCVYVFSGCKSETSYEKI